MCYCIREQGAREGLYCVLLYKKKGDKKVCADYRATCLLIILGKSDLRAIERLTTTLKIYKVVVEAINIVLRYSHLSLRGCEKIFGKVGIYM